MNSKKEDTHQVLESLLTFILNRFKLKACAIIKRTQTYQTALLSMDFWDIIHKQTHAYNTVSVQQPYTELGQTMHFNFHFSFKTQMTPPLKVV